eukprot:7384361-Prymnesium_polylepis.1
MEHHIAHGGASSRIKRGDSPGTGYRAAGRVQIGIHSIKKGRRDLVRPPTSSRYSSMRADPAGVMSRVL